MPGQIIGQLGRGQLGTFGIGWAGNIPGYIYPTPFQNQSYILGPTLLQTTAPGSATFAVYTVFIGGVDRTGYIRVGQPIGPGININKQINSRGTCAFTTLDVTGGGFTAARGDTVEVFEGSTVMFRGFVDRVTEHHLQGTNPAATDGATSCIDRGILCDRRIAGISFDDPFLSVGIAAFRIITDFLQGTGITLVPNFVSSFSMVGPITFPYITVTEAFNILARVGNCDWTIDDYGNLVFFTISNGYLAAPATFTDATNNWIDMRVTRTRARFANRWYAKTSINLGALWTDSFTVPAGGSLGFLTRYIQTSAPQVFVNGVAQRVVELSNIGAFGNTNYDFYWIQDGYGVSYNQALTPLAPGDIVLVIYSSPLPYVAIAEDAASIAAIGLFEDTIEAGAIADKSTLQDIADAALLRGVEEPAQVEISTRVSGFGPGQRVAVNTAHPAVNDNFLIESVSSREVEQHWFVHTIRASNKQFQFNANPSRFLGDIIRRSRVDTPNIIERIPFLIAGTLENGGVPELTTGVKPGFKTAQKHGLAGWVVLRWKSVDDGTPTTTDIEIDIYQNGASIFGATKLVFPAGGSGEVKMFAFASDPLVVDVGDVFSYEVLTADSLATDGSMQVVVLG